MNSIKIKETLIKYADTFFGETPVLFAYLYGSYAVHQTHPFSDLDIAVYLKKPLTTREIMKLEMGLSLEMDKRFPGGPAAITLSAWEDRGHTDVNKDWQARLLLN